MTADQAIDHIAEDYPGWGKKYSSSRPEWIARLKQWEKDNKKERQSWNSAHHTHTQLWKAKYPSSFASVKKDEKEENNEKNEKSSVLGEPVKKKAKV